ncbi:MAG: efflux RND transporter permease subunit [Candidatus Moduliflexus flocculans]|nr:efflux RND transporter permease subunit [Candidatus Moduliflexus flocculans]
MGAGPGDPALVPARGAPGQERADSAVKLAGLGRRPDFLAGFLLPSVRPNAWGVSFGLTLPFLGPGRARGLALEAGRREPRPAAWPPRPSRGGSRTAVESAYAAAKSAEEPGPGLRTGPARASSRTSCGIQLEYFRYGKTEAFGLLDLHRTFVLAQVEHLRALLLYNLALADLEVAGEETRVTENPMRDSSASLIIGPPWRPCSSSSAPAAAEAVVTRARRRSRDGHEAAAPIGRSTLTPEAIAAADIRTEHGRDASSRSPGHRPRRARMERPSRRPSSPRGPPGRLERVLAVRGDRVREGQLLAELYSPDYLTLQAEYLQAAAAAQAACRRSGRGRPGPGHPGRRPRAARLLGGARCRDRRPWRRVRAPRPLLAVRAPLAGTVLESDVVAGDARRARHEPLPAGRPVDALGLPPHPGEGPRPPSGPGPRSTLRAQAYPGRGVPRPARSRRRRRRCRDAHGRGAGSRSPIAGGRLKAGHVRRGRRGRRPASGRPWPSPRSAVQDDGGRPIVFVRTGERTFARREVETGERLGGAVEVLEGLARGRSRGRRRAASCSSPSCARAAWRTSMGMIDRLIEAALRRRGLVLVGVVLLVALGVWSVLRIPIDAFPDVTNIQVEVLSTAPGMSPPEVERFVTYPVETAMRGLPRLGQVRSVSKAGLSVVTVVFEDGVDVYFARQLVLERLIEARERVPAGHRDRHGPGLDGHGRDLPVHPGRRASRAGRTR